MAKYRLKCLYPGCNKEYEGGSNYRLCCDDEASLRHGPALLMSLYEKKQLSLHEDLPGLFQYSEWLPTGPYYIKPADVQLGKPYTYKSDGLAKRLKLKDLHIAFSGYWPEKTVNLLTRTFKEFESQVGVVRFLSSHLDKKPMPLVVSSAGNTGNGYNLITHILGLPLYLVVPETGLDKLILPFKTDPFLVSVIGDYAHAIDLADKIAEETGLVKEGGVRNVARRAGLGAVMLDAVANPKYGTGYLFDHYFQAVGSATGAIAAREAVQLLLNDGRFGKVATKIHMAQNSPFTPIPDSWEGGSRKFLDSPSSHITGKVTAVTADVLTNRYPAYSIHGGIFDVLTASKGLTWRVNNYQVFHAARMFRETEGIDIGPAAAVAVNALKQAVDSGKVAANDKVLLHITGGGKEIQYSKGPVYGVEPRITVKPEDLSSALKAIGSPSRISQPMDFLKKYE